MKHKIIAVLAIFGMAMVFTGCWDNVEINEKHVVLDFAVDKNPDTKMQTQTGIENVYKVTYSIPDIAKLSGNDSLSDEVKKVLSVNSSTMAKSVSDIEKKTQNTISFSHTKAIMVGSELMKDQDLFKMAIDSFRENMEIGRGTYLLAVDGEAGDVCKASSYQNPIIGLYVMKYFNNTERRVGDNEGQTLGGFSRDMQEIGNSIIPKIASNEDESTVKVAGGALIKDYEFVDWLDSREIRAKMLIQGKVKNMPLTIEDEDQYFTYQINKERCKLSFEEQNNELVINMNIEIDGGLTEYSPEILRNTGTEQQLAIIKEKINNNVKSDIANGIQKAKEVKVSKTAMAFAVF